MRVAVCITSGLLVKRVLDFLERETASARCFVAELYCGPQRLLKCHNDAVIGVIHRASPLDREARKLSAERAERHGGVGRALRRGSLEVDAHAQGA